MHMYSTPNELLYDLDALKDISRDNNDFLVSLCKIFIETVPQNSREMVEAAAARNWESVGKLAHKLKSTIDTMNIASIRQDIRLIEMNAKAKAELQLIEVLVKKVHTTLLQTSEQLQHRFGL